MSDHDNANQNPTPTQIARAHQRGQFAVSREMISASIWLAGAAVLATLGPRLWSALQHMARQSWSAGSTSIDSEQLMRHRMFDSLWSLEAQLLIVFVVIVVIALIVQLAQTRLSFLPHLALPDLHRLTPWRNLSRMFSAENFTAVGLGIVKFTLLMGIAIWIVVSEVPSMIRIGQQPINTGADQAAQWLFFVSLKLALGCVAVGMVDYAIQWWLNRRRLRMTDDEIRQEQRITEPAPEVEARRRLLSEQMRQQRHDLVRQERVARNSAGSTSRDG